MSQNPAFIVAMVVGTIMLLTVCFVYVRTQAFGLGGGALSCLGVALIGMSVWSSMDFKLTSSGISARLDQVAASVHDASNRATQAQQQATQVATQATHLAQRFDVASTQASLKEKGIYTGVADGYFGADTSAALMKFQSHSGLPASGKMDADTLHHLGVRPVSNPALFDQIAVHH
jgi:murein L,D-transpeptidase YcbB/YkuD